MTEEYRVEIRRTAQGHNAKYRENINGVPNDSPSDDLGRIILESSKKMFSEHNFKELTTTFKGESW